MSREQNLATLARGGEIAATRDFAGLSEVFADDVVDHDAAAGAPNGAAGVIAWWQSVGTAFPDFEMDVDVVVSDDDSIAFAYRLSGTHEGEFLDRAPTGRRVEVRGLQIARFEDGRIVERWGATDLLGLLTQLDLVPGQPPALTGNVTG